MADDLILICAVADVPENDVIGASANGHPLAVYNVDGDIYATDDLCSHGNARLSEGFLDGKLIECPLHAGCFDVTNGAPCTPPVEHPVRAYTLILEGGNIYLRAADLAAAQSTS